MSNRDIFFRAIGKAAKNGYEIPIGADKTIVSFARAYGKTTVFTWYAKSIIFSHDFAEALWGDSRGTEYRHKEGDDPNTYQLFKLGQRGWRGHLERMVMAEDPFKYLGDNLPR